MKSDNVVERRYVEIGPEIGNNTVIERGLAKGERIVTEGFHKLNPGQKVRPVVLPPDTIGKKDEI